MPGNDPRRRGFAEQIGTAVENLGAGVGEGSSTAVTQMRQITSTDPGVAFSSSLSGDTYTKRTATDASSPVVIVGTDMPAGAWVVQGKVTAVWGGASGTLWGQLKDGNGNVLGQMHVSEVDDALLPIGMQFWEADGGDPGLRLEFGSSGGTPGTISGYLEAVRVAITLTSD